MQKSCMLQLWLRLQSERGLAEDAEMVALFMQVAQMGTLGAPQTRTPWRVYLLFSDHAA